MFNPGFARFKRRKASSGNPVLSQRSGQLQLSHFFSSQQRGKEAAEDSVPVPAKKSRLQEEVRELSTLTKDRIHRFAADNPPAEDVANGQPRESRGAATGRLPATVSSSSRESTGSQLSHLEVQVTELKVRHPGMVLMVQNGYRYCFYGEDAEIASRVLHIAAVTHRNFLTASIPLHRLQVHARHLVEEGYKVGVVKQTETAALKAVSENKNTVFCRELSCVYTKATLIGDDVNPLLQDGEAAAGDGKTAFILCVSERVESPGKVTLGIVALDPGTGESYYDGFEDTHHREQLEKRLAHLMPAEVIAPETLTAETEKLLKRSPARLEQMPVERFDFSPALVRVATFLTLADSSNAQELSELAPAVVSSLGALLLYLQDIGLQRALRPQGLRSFTSRSRHLQMDAAALRNLEVLCSSEGGVRGSLLWLLDRARTRFGSRLLREWVSQPLRERAAIEERQHAVAELLHSPSDTINMLQSLLTGLPDVDRGLTAILHNRCTPSSLYVVVQSLGRLHTDLESLLGVAELDLHSPMLRTLLEDTVQLLEGVSAYLCNLDMEAARQGDVTKFLRDYSDFPSVTELMGRIADITRQLEEQRPVVARQLGLMSVKYMSVAGHEYLMEVRAKQPVPRDWRVVSQTKQLSRYRPPQVDHLVGELSRLRERLKARCKDAWVEFTAAFSQHYFEHKKAVRNVATLDALLSLSQVARSPGYCRPVLLDSDNTTINIKQGRHPIICALHGTDAFVPNDTSLQTSGQSCMILSGPNMGGKSSYMRQVALITLMAHMGSYVPAEEATISILDTVYTRMGARDQLFEGRSTLLLELQEASSILQEATPRSLALIDELGRGTSSCDGAAIAVATLEHLVRKVRCLTLYVTHYPSVRDLFPELNYHMGFMVHHEEAGDADAEADTNRLTFLYQVTVGAASCSYGLNVAHLAGIPSQLLMTATAKARALEQGIEERSKLRQSLRHWWCFPDSRVPDSNPQESHGTSTTTGLTPVM